MVFFFFFSFTSFGGCGWDYLCDGFNFLFFLVFLSFRFLRVHGVFPFLVLFSYGPVGGRGRGFWLAFLECGTRRVCLYWAISWGFSFFLHGTRGDTWSVLGGAQDGNMFIDSELVTMVFDAGVEAEYIQNDGPRKNGRRHGDILVLG